VVEDYNLAPLYHGVIVKAIQDQLSDYRAHSPNYDGDSWNIVRTNNTLRQGTLEGESAQWWGNWRKRLRTEYGFVRAERNKRRKLGKVVKDKPEDEQPMSVEEFTVNNKTLHEDMRILIRVSFLLGESNLSAYLSRSVAGHYRWFYQTRRPI
jgi:SWI/SNF-related matrix-associated actin-dependent regulator of chromatin subfamily B protein 1